MEMEFKDPSRRRRRLILLLGVLLAGLAGAAAFQLASQGAPAQAFATRKVVVALADIPSRTTLNANHLAVRDLPVSSVPTQAVEDPTRVIGLVTGVMIFANQPITPNLLATGSADAAFAILSAEETVAPDSPFWRAVSVMVPDDRAAGGEISPGQRVDLIANLQLQLLTYDPTTGEFTEEPSEDGSHSGMSTKATFADLQLLDHNEDSNIYVLKVDLHQAEEISLLQADADNTFTLALRPEEDTRPVDQTQYGETIERIIEQYRFLVPKLLDLELLQAPPVPTPAPAASPGAPTPAPVQPTAAPASVAP